MSNIFNPSGGTTTVTDLSGNNWKALYTNGSGTVTELALGADGTTLVGNGTSSAPTFGNLTDLKGGNDKVLFTNSSGVLTELAIGATGTYLKSAGTTSDPTWATAGGNWAEVAKGATSSGSATTFNITSLSNYRALRGWFTFPSLASGTGAVNWTVNGLTGNYYKVTHQKYTGTTAAISGMWTGTAGGSSYNGSQAYVMFDIYFLAQGYETTNRATIYGVFNLYNPVSTGTRDMTQWAYDEPITSDTGLTALNVYSGASTVHTSTGYNSYYVEGYTQS
jgi:hypothetical protein